MVENITMVIRADVQIIHEHFRITSNLRIAILHICFTSTQRFYFRTSQGNARLINFVDSIIVACFSIFCYNLNFLFCHNYLFFLCFLDCLSLPCFALLLPASLFLEPLPLFDLEATKVLLLTLTFSLALSFLPVLVPPARFCP